MDKLVFSDSGDEIKKQSGKPWKLLVADDEGDVHLVTKMVLSDFRFEDRPLEIVSCYSAEETEAFMRKEGGAAVLLLDVVMESYNAGLDVVNTIRQNINDREIRIILRSGQAGYSNISEIVRNYDINDFLRKESLRHQDLKDAIILALRAYRDIQIAKDEQIAS